MREKAKPVARAWGILTVGLCLVVTADVAGDEPKPAAGTGTATAAGTGTTPAAGTATATATPTATATATATGTATGTAEIPPKPDCHGPLYYKLMNQDKEQRKVESARDEVARFANANGEKLVKARYAQAAALMAQRKEEWLACLKQTRRPSVLCQAVVLGDEKRCMTLVSPERREPCLLLARVSAAVVGGRPELCAAVAEGPERKLCEFASGGQWACDQLPDGPPARVCAAVAGGAPGGVLPAGLSPEEQAAAAWLRAIVTRDSTTCNLLPDDGEKGACRAAAARHENVCPPARETIEHLDEDYSCRNLVLSWRAHALTAGTEVVVLLGGDFPGKAACEVKARMAAGGTGAEGTAPRDRTIGSVFPGKGLDFTEIRARLEGPVEAVEAVCRWDLVSSRFILKESDAGVW